MIANGKLLGCAVGFYLLASTAAQAQLVIQPVINTAPVYAPPPPVVYPGPVISTWDPHHRRHDLEYWHQHRVWERDHWAYH